MESEGLAGLHIGFGIRVKCALDGKHTKRSAEGGPFPLLVPFIVCVYVGVFCFYFLLECSLSYFEILGFEEV